MTWILTLEYFEGELLSLFENEEGDFYLYSWCDCKNSCNRWLVFRITPKSLQEYIERKKTFRDLMLNPVDRFFYALDIDDDRTIVNSFLVPCDRLPELYIPEVDSFYSFSDLHPATQERDRKIIQEKVYNFSLI
nr:DUF6575 domain-containing protein [Spirulina major]